MTPYIKSEASNVSRLNAEREFLNAKTTHDSWLVVQKLLDIIDAQEEIIFHLKNGSK